MLLSGLSAMAETVETNAASHTVEQRDVPLIVNGRINPGASIRLWFLDGVEDLPYVELKGFTDRLNEWFSDGETDYVWDEDEESGTCSITYDQLMDEDPAVADAALRNFINFYLDDLHSGFQLVSPMTGFHTELPNERLGFSASADQFLMTVYERMRSRAFPDGVPFYQEVGNTAFVTFDRFSVTPGLDYYSLDLDDPDCVQDTISLILYANRRIRREGSPVKNVVLDLSLNSGGRTDAAVFVTGWFLGKSSITAVNTFSGAQATGIYLADTNLDRVFDGSDCLLGEYNLYCLISPESFSCGNLLPCQFKASGMVTLLGDTSGGGSCEVFPMTTAWGTSITISGCKRLSFIKNGSFYDIDRGIEPDVVFTRIPTFYNREKVTEIINNLY